MPSSLHIPVGLLLLLLATTDLYAQPLQTIFSRSEDCIYLLTDEGTALEWRVGADQVRHLRAAPTSLQTGLNNRLAVVQKGEIQLWKGTELESHYKLPGTLGDREWRLSTISPYSILLAQAGEEDLIITNIRTGEVRQIFQLSGHTFTGLHFSKCGQYLAATLANGQLIVWDTDSWQPVHVWTSTRSHSTDLAWYPPAPVMAYAEGHIPRFYDMDSRQEWTTTDTIYRDITRMAFHPTTDQVAIGRTDGSVQLLHFRTNKVMLTLQTGENAVQQLAYSRDGRHLLVGNSQQLFLYNPATGDLTLHRGVEALLQKAQDVPSVLAGQPEDGLTIFP